MEAEHRSRLRDANRADEPLLEAMTVEAVYLPDGSDPVSRSLLDDPRLRRYFEGFGAQPDDVGVVATSDSVDPASPARRLYERLGFVHLGWEGTSMTMIRQLGTAVR